MNVEKEIQDRIIAAANSLYEQGGRAVFPKVDTVRKEARANMNDVSEVMKFWRAKQMARPEPVVVHVPDTVAQAGHAALVMLWQSAQELSNNALRAAQKSWEADRQAADLLSQEMADAYDARTLELDAAQAQINELHTSVTQALNEKTQLQMQIEQMRLELSAAKMAADNQVSQLQTQHRSEVDALNRAMDSEKARRLEEVQLQRDDLNENTQKAVSERDQFRAEIAQLKAQAQASENQARVQRESDLERLKQAEALHNESQHVAAMAREAAAELRGQLVAMKTQMSDVLQIIASRQTSQVSDTTHDPLPGIEENASNVGG